MNKVRIAILAFLLIAQTQQAFAISCKDARQTVKNFNSQISTLEKRRATAENMVSKLLTGTLMTKEKARQLNKSCLKFMKGYAQAKTFCDYSKDIGTYSYVCQTSECGKYLQQRLTFSNQLENLKKDVSQVTLNSKECFSATEVLNAQKVS